MTRASTSTGPETARRRSPLSPALLALGCGLGLLACEAEAEDPDGSWSVTVTGLSTDCTDSTQGFQKTFQYQIFYDDTDLSRAEIKIDGESFASGFISGCTLEYQSAIWLEEESGGNYRWQIVGNAEHQGAAGGCDLPDGVDWFGTETLVVLESENEGVPEGCTYEMESEGTWAG